MNVKEAVKKAIEYIADIFESENLENIGLEEVALDDKANTWEVTVGFSRPWDHEKGGLISNIQRLKRDYKIVCIDNKTEEVKSIKIREVSNA